VGVYREPKSGVKYWTVGTAGLKRNILVFAGIFILVICSLVLILLSFAMFSVTGRYPQLAFNLGNRVTIYSSLLAAYFIVLVPLPKKINYLFLSSVGEATSWSATSLTRGW